MGEKALFQDAAGRLGVRGSATAGVSCCSVNKLQAHWGPLAPDESFIFLSAMTPPPLINACPGVFFSGAEAAFFKTALLIGKG